MSRNDIYETLLSNVKKSTMQHKYACVIVHRNKIIATGYNYRTIGSKSCIL